MGVKPSDPLVILDILTHKGHFLGYTGLQLQLINRQHPEYLTRLNLILLSISNILKVVQFRAGCTRIHLNENFRVKTHLCDDKMSSISA